MNYTHWENDGNIIRASVHPAKKAGSLWVIFSHGFTSHRMGPAYLYVALSRHLSSIGAASLRFDFSGAGESDGAFSSMTVSSMRRDLVSALRYVKENHSPSACIVFGHSLGACVACMASDEAEIDGLILLAPVADPMSHVKNYAHILSGGQNIKGAYELGPYEMTSEFLEDLKQASPFETLLKGFSGKMLIFQGEADQKVLREESAQYAGWAEKNGIDAQYHIIQKADHRLSTVACRDDLFKITAKWIKEKFA